MKKKNVPVRARNTLAKQLRNCSTNEERWFLLHIGSTRPTELEQFFNQVLEFRSAERRFKSFGANIANATRHSFDQWRTGLEERTGKIILPLLMEGDSKTISALARVVEKMEKLNVHYSRESDPLRLALLTLVRYRVAPLRISWKKLETELAELRAGTHAREHILRVIKELKIQIQIIPAKRGRSRI